MGKFLVGLDIGSQAVKLVSFLLTPQGPLLTHIGLKAIPPEEERDLDFIGEVVKALLRELDLQPKKVRLVCSGPGLHIRRLSLPPMPGEELREAVRWEMKGQIPQPIESLEVRFHILSEKKEKESSSPVDLIAVACPLILLERLLMIAEKSGLHASHLDVAPFALWNLLLTCRPSAAEERLALIDLGAEKTGIYIFQGGVLQFSREIIPGGADLTRAIREGLEPGDKPHLLLSRAEKIKQIVGVPVGGPYEKIPGETISVAKISFLIRPVLERLVGEISRSLEYYRTQYSGEKIDRLLLCGGGANMKNMAFYLSEELRLPVERFNPWPPIPFAQQNVDGEFLKNLGPQFAVAAGVALPPLKEMEFLSPKESLTSRLRRGKNPYLLAASLTAAIFAALIWGVGAEFSKLKKEHELKTTQLQDLERLPLTLSSLKEREGQMKQNLSLLSSSMVWPFSYREILEEMRVVVPANITITLLNIEPQAEAAKKEDSSTALRKELQIIGLAFGDNNQCLRALAQMIEYLERSPLFRNAKLVAASENKHYNTPALQFEMVCEIEQERKTKR